MDFPGIQRDMHELRWDLHQHPELSHEETRTQTVLAAHLRRLGLEPVVVGKTGLYADIIGNPDGPMVCIRADIDALPVHECSGVRLASRVAGVMHACGHDVHAAAAWGAAAMLVQRPPAGRVRVLFQPAEECGAGALLCIADGAMVDVDAIIGGHVDLDYPVGTVALQPGAMCASSDHFRLEVIGQGGHGARPHQGIDAVVAASHLVLALQLIVAREVRPGAPAVITVGKLVAGERANILASNAVLEGTVRAQSRAIRRQLREGIERVCAGIAATTNTRVAVEYHSGNPPIVNDGSLVHVVAGALHRAEQVSETVPLCQTNMGAEDFSAYLSDRPGVYVRWGACGESPNGAPAHSGGFRVDPAVLDVAAHGFAQAAHGLVEHLVQLRDRRRPLLRAVTSDP